MDMDMDKTHKMRFPAGARICQACSGLIKAFMSSRRAG